MNREVVEEDRRRDKKKREKRKDERRDGSKGKGKETRREREEFADPDNYPCNTSVSPLLSTSSWVHRWQITVITVLEYASACRVECVIWKKTEKNRDNRDKYAIYHK